MDQQTQEQGPITALSDFIIAEVNRQMGTDAIRALVEKQVGQTAERAVADAFRSYGDINKQISAAISQALALNGKLDLPAYGNTIMVMLRAKMDGVLHELVAERLAKEAEEILQIAPKEVRLSAVVAAMMEGIDVGERYGSRATCVIDASTAVPGYLNIYLDESDKPDRDKYLCECQIGVTNTGQIYSLKVDKKDVKTTFVLGQLSPYQKMVFAAYCCGSTLIVDQTDFSTSIGDD